MYKVLKKQEKEREDAISVAKTYVFEISKKIGKLTAVMHGSFARGDFNLGSDIDVVIISDNLPHHPIERMDLLYGCVDCEIEPKGYTCDEFKRLIKSKNPIAVDIMKYGVVLMDDGFLSMVDSTG